MYTWEFALLTEACSQFDLVIIFFLIHLVENFTVIFCIWCVTFLVKYLNMPFGYQLWSGLNREHCRRRSTRSAQVASLRTPTA